MCGRFTLSAEREELEKAFSGLAMPEAAGGRFNVAPAQSTVIVRRSPSGGREAVMCRWGLVPRWADDPAMGYRLINARAETVGRRPAFRDSFRSRRCLVPADGFYEWLKPPGARARRPVFFRLRSGEIFAFAGLWDEWRREATVLRTFTIITCPANELVRRVHDRMPVILRAGAEWDRWLSEPAMELLRPLPAELMEGWLVDPRVNNPAVDDAGCVERAGEVPQAGDFGG